MFPFFFSREKRGFPLKHTSHCGSCGEALCPLLSDWTALLMNKESDIGVGRNLTGISGWIGFKFVMGTLPVFACLSVDC